MYNEYKVVGDITIIYIPYKEDIYECLISTKHLPIVQEYDRWYIEKGRNTYYACTTDRIKLHRVIMEPTEGQVVDHIDGNGLNNVDTNLRCVSVSQNNANRQNKSEGKTSKYLNVYYHNQNKVWTARVKVNKKTITLGSYDLEWVAALVALEYKKSVYGVDYVPKDIEQELLDLKSKYPDEYHQCIEAAEFRKRYRGGSNKTTSGIKGVSWRESRKRWMATLRVDGKVMNLGQYTDKYEAGRAVTKATLEFLGSEYVHRTPIKLEEPL